MSRKRYTNWYSLGIMENSKRNDELDAIFHALADRTRRDILARLSKENLSIKTLAQNYSMTLAAVSKHIRVLEKAKFVRTTKEGRVHKCEIDFAPIQKIESQIEFYKRFWASQFESIEEYLEENKDGKK